MHPDHTKHLLIGRNQSCSHLHGDLFSMEKRSLGWRTAAALTALCQKSMVATRTSLQPPQIYAGGFRRDNGTKRFEEKHFGSQMTCNLGTSDQISPLANPTMLDKSALVGVQTQSPLPYLFLEPLPWKPSLTSCSWEKLNTSIWRFKARQKQFL